MLVAADELADAERISTRVIEAGRSAGSLFMVVSGHAMRTFALRSSGPLGDAVADAAIALETASDITSGL